jgi:hypothetical protein
LIVYTRSKWYAVLELLEKYKIDFGEKRDEEIRITVDLRELDALMVHNEYPACEVSGRGIDHIQRALAHVQIPYAAPARDVMAWRERDTVKIVAFNAAENEKTYLLDITGIDPDGNYVYCRQKSPEVPHLIRGDVEVGSLSWLDRDIVETMYSVSGVLGEVIMQEEISMNIRLKKGQAEKVILQKVKG